ncbi:MAG: hypothetical protein A2909_02920 [Candidatus Tagabacteria bacterium RIFCSPLOWO2_01_FULL_39_11]|uniref:Restriction endonuclease type II DpnII-like domain-containing protein n=1 Tax=Candidatus Tagabacteria bacterium RIFCSPLOWO2_01_FULL_39_11 TaxID=1802295 RepID=A0A1G2LRH4_9BACT|nr:MAG: hypothetical protein A2909_02920 [Candidatus Tagabacteria bacterium RIFCSPLOWO2_01_FULL_39_11]
MIKPNLYYFRLSKECPEKPLDKFYIFDEKHKDLKKYISKTKEIKKFLITIKTLENSREKREIIDKYYFKLQKSLNEYSNASEFNAFVNACDSYLKVVREDIKLLKEITKRYFEKRLLKEIAPEEWIQAILDSHASRKKGQARENKLLKILEGEKYKIFKKGGKWSDFLKIKKAAAKFSSGKKSDFNISKVRKNLNIKMQTTKQNKILDLIIKNGNKFFILEAKHINASGGAQDKQISELIEITSLKEKSENMHYIVFLDGYKSNLILGDEIKSGGKLKQQQKEILLNLKKNKNSFWLNTAGFSRLIKDLK